MKVDRSIVWLCSLHHNNRLLNCFPLIPERGWCFKFQTTSQVFGLSSQFQQSRVNLWTRTGSHRLSCLLHDDDEDDDDDALFKQALFKNSSNSTLRNGFSLFYKELRMYSSLSSIFDLALSSFIGKSYWHCSHWSHIEREIAYQTQQQQQHTQQNLNQPIPWCRHFPA